VPKRTTARRTRAVCYAGPHELKQASVSVGAPGPNEVVVAVSFVGICGTDLHIYLGHMAERVSAGTPLGHESSGVVLSMGDEATDLAIGDSVCLFPLRPCGECRTCQQGRPNACPYLQILGIDAPGAMQDSWVVQRDNLMKVPPGVSLDRACLVEPLAVAVHDVRVSRLAAGERALVVGGGPVGVLIALVAREVGADVTVVEISEYRRAFASGLGLHAVDANAPESELRGCDVSFEVTGSEGGFRSSFEALVPGGRLVAVGIHPSGRLVDMQAVFRRETEILGARLYSRGDFESAIDLVSEGRVDPQPLITDVLPFGDADIAFQRLLAGQDAMKLHLGPDE
jgi:(R,R)-butanediol dehydrogenase/meso-butanediol dehydrogenase/diacetyl reductase